MVMRSRLSVSAVLLAVAVVAAGCSSSKKPSVGGGPMRPADTLRVGIERPQSLDPAQARSPSELLVAEQLFDGLTAYDAATSAVVPAVAPGLESTAPTRPTGTSPSGPAPRSATAGSSRRRT